MKFLVSVEAVFEPVIERDLPYDRLGWWSKMFSNQRSVVHGRCTLLRDRVVWECTLHDLSCAESILWIWERSYTLLGMQVLTN